MIFDSYLILTLTVLIGYLEFKKKRIKQLIEIGISSALNGLSIYAGFGYLDQFLHLNLLDSALYASPTMGFIVAIALLCAGIKSILNS